MSSSNPKGMIHLAPGSAIVEHAISTRLAEGAKRPLEPVDIRLADFDSVLYRISVDAEDREHISVSIAMRCMAELKQFGGQVMIDELYPGMEVPAEQGFDLTIKFNPDQLPCSAEEMVKRCSQLKRNLLGAPLDQSFAALTSGGAGNLPPIEVHYREVETMYVIPGADRVSVIFSVDFADNTDLILARVFLQEFADAQRGVSGSPPVSFSRDPPRELASMNTAERETTVGYLTLIIFDSHVNSAEKRENTVNLIVGFRSYLLYHIKACKSYLHTRMRRRVTALLQVLNRARPEKKEEKKTMRGASGKTFKRA